MLNFRFRLRSTPIVCMFFRPKLFVCPQLTALQHFSFLNNKIITIRHNRICKRIRYCHIVQLIDNIHYICCFVCDLAIYQNLSFGQSYYIEAF